MSAFWQGPWWGKVIGGLIGFAIKGPLAALLGGLLGHQFDRGLRDYSTPDDVSQGGQNSELMFFSTFTVMGHLAKADGRVSEQEISAASQVMRAWKLDDAQIKRAIAFFNQGKSSGFKLHDVVSRFRAATRGHHELVLSFVQAQLSVMLADHQIHPATRQQAWEICQMLGVSRVEMASIEASLRGASPVGDVKSLDQAYATLEMDHTASDDELKTAFRRMMNRYHPDKLIGTDVTQAQRDKAVTKLERCKDAWDMIKTARGLR